ncbi:MAG: glycosyltransferase family 2 protein [Candidatus Methanoperedens sp.]|nr:glycosyltransferase family 2 protein [Candidatus Methanoperedens sp.]MCE8427977.1 glycosyltransferase family 2 protein [Candidatus Methanoperedens sp.]
MVEISIVLPAYNEASRIEITVERTAAALRDMTASFEIIIAEDGSKDGTDMISSALARKYDFVVHLHSDERQGRGRALNRAFKSARGEILGYIDVDLATNMKHLREMIQYIREDYDFATGSRMLPESNVKRPFKRGVASKGFNFIVRMMLGSKLYDHQCGFKAFKRQSLYALLDKVKDTYWFWDTELFVRAQRAGYRVKEFPVDWKHGGTTKVNMVRDVFEMGYSIFRLWYEFLWE